MINTNLKIKNIFSIFLALMVTLFAGIILVNASSTITPATGASSVSIDNTTATGGTGAWVSLTNLVIAEGASGDIGSGIHTLSLPDGWEFNNSQDVTIVVSGSSELALLSNTITPETTTLSFDVSTVSSSGLGSLSFSEIQVRPTGTTPATGHITQSVGTIAGVTNGTTSFGTLTSIPGTVTQIAVTIEPTATVYGSTISSVVVNTKDRFGNNSVSGLGSSENVVISIASGTGTLSGILTKDIGTGGGNGAVTFSDLYINNVGAFTLDVTSATYTDDTSASFNVTQKPVTATITASSKVYDKSTTATITSATPDGTVGADDLTVNYSSATAAFVDANVNTGIKVNATGLTLGGTSASLYSFAAGTASTTADITAKPLTVTGATVTTKIYDGNTSATITGAELSGVESGDVVTLGDATSGTFNDKTVASSKSVTTAMTISGDSSTNYTLTQPTLTGEITAKPLTVTGATVTTKIYDGNTSATITGAELSGVESGDVVTLGDATSGTFNDKTVASSKSVTTAMTISGDSATNYTITQPTLTGEITAKPLTVTGATVTTKIYDGNTSATITGAELSGVESGDVVTLGDATSGTFNDKTVASSKSVTTAMTISGDSATNYTITQPTLTGEITAKELTVSGITASDKVYDSTTSATLYTSSPAFVGIISGDIVNLITTGASGIFSSASIGSGKTVTISGITKNGADALNYTITQPTTTADITAGALHHFNVVVSTSPVVGVPTNITITAVDQYDNTISAANLVTPFTGQVFIETDGSNATYNANTSFVAGDEGTKTLTGGITFNSAENDRSVSVYNFGATVLGTTGANIDVSASDTTAPVISSISLDKGTYRLTQDANITVTVVEDDTASTVLISGTNGTEDSAGTWTRTFAHGKSAVGTYSFNVVATDANSNQSIVTVFYNVVADDAAAPTTVTIDSPTAGATVSGSVTLTSTNGTEYQIDGGSWVAIGTAWDTQPLFNGSHTVKVKGGDPVGYSETIVVIVDNTPAQGDGSLAVTRISTTRSYGTADDTYTNGWAWVFDITVPTSEELLSMKFSNWISGEDTIATANNMRIYSAESLNASDSSSAITITSAGTYSSNLTLNADLNSSLEGRQVKVIVEMKIPKGSSGASYSASYGVNSD